MHERFDVGSDAAFFTFRSATSNDCCGHEERILRQAREQGFVGDLRIYNLGHDTEDSISLVIEGIYEGERCCVAVGYGMNRHHLAIRKIWYRRGPGRHKH